MTNIATKLYENRTLSYLLLIWIHLTHCVAHRYRRTGLMVQIDLCYHCKDNFHGFTRGVARFGDSVAPFSSRRSSVDGCYVPVRVMKAFLSSNC
jgi:hypothetical protein